MESFVLFFIVTLIILTIMNHVKKNKKITYKVSSIDNRKYLVRKDTPDPQKSADKLAELNIIIQKIIKKALENKDHPTIERLHLYNPDTLSESIPGETAFTSYSINKGEKIGICLLHPDFTFIDMNDIIFVTLHEISHILTIEEQHPPIFWKNFAFLIGVAEEIGLYKPIDYSKDPKKYCGQSLTHSPYFDKKNN